MSTRSVSSPNEPRWLWLLCLSLVVVRCQPLRRALCFISTSDSKDDPGL
ncbi:exlusion protein FxsA [Vibrio tarriae]|nr:exlusion protein FxsA [Vibrio tarriae]